MGLSLPTQGWGLSAIRSSQLGSKKKRNTSLTQLADSPMAIHSGPTQQSVNVLQNPVKNGNNDSTMRLEAPNIWMCSRYGYMDRLHMLDAKHLDRGQHSRIRMRPLLVS